MLLMRDRSAVAHTLMLLGRAVLLRWGLPPRLLLQVEEAEHVVALGVRVETPALSSAGVVPLRQRGPDAVEQGLEVGDAPTRQGLGRPAEDVRGGSHDGVVLDEGAAEREQEQREEGKRSS